MILPQKVAVVRGVIAGFFSTTNDTNDTNKDCEWV
jgi:hypothetical protein